MPSFDYCGFVVGEKQDEAILYGKAAGILAGQPFFQRIFEYLGCTVEWKLRDGDCMWWWWWWWRRRG